MYRKKSRGWYKHKDFILIDLACLFMALILAYLIRNGSVRNLFTLGIYRNVMIFVILVDLFLIILFESYKGVLRRGRYQELRSVIRQMILIELASGLYLFTVSGGHTFSRIILYLMGIFYVLLSYCTRIIWKKRLLHKMAEGGEHSLYIVTNYDLASKVIQNVKEHNYNRYNINGLILIDKDMTGKEIVGVPVVADLNNAPSFICQQWVDEVFVNVDETYPYPQELIEELLEMGMPVHVNLAKVRSTPGQKQFVEAIGGYTVLTTTMNYATDRQALAKRVLDILGGLVGCFLTGIIFIFIAPAIYISSPGPIFFSQTRIGKNGKPFKMYKFRSMYMDAEARKAELMKENRMGDSKMFKLDFDPRVIGNKIFPDGTKKTGIGNFIRTKLIKHHYTLFLNIAASISAACLVYALLLKLSEVCFGISSFHEAGYICSMLFIIPGFPFITSGIDLAKLDLRSGLERLTYAIIIVLVATMFAWIMALLLKLKPVDFAAMNIDPILHMFLRIITSFCGVFGFSIMFNSAIPIAATAALIGAAANTLRLELIDFTQMPSAEAAFIGALTAGLLASIIKRNHGYPRISITVPSIVIMVPGLYLYRAIYNLGIMSLNESVSWFAAAIMIIAALPLGLIFARILTDRTFRYCT